MREESTGTRIVYEPEDMVQFAPASGLGKAGNEVQWEEYIQKFGQGPHRVVSANQSSGKVTIEVKQVITVPHCRLRPFQELTGRMSAFRG